jgi:hypothetical protein
VHSERVPATSCAASGASTAATVCARASGATADTADDSVLRRSAGNDVLEAPAGAEVPARTSSARTRSTAMDCFGIWWGS